MREAEVAVFVVLRGRTEALVAHRAPERGAYWLEGVRLSPPLLATFHWPETSHTLRLLLAAP